MEMSVIMESLDSKSVLVTGATGFLAKLFVEKVLRTQPNVKKLYLLVRANDEILAKKRVEKDVVSKKLFNVLREKYGDSFDPFFWSKVHAVQGDTTLENMGIKDANLIEVLCREVDYIVNSAANTRFNERYDVSISTNTFGPRNVLLFAKTCENLKMFLHISTAYVSKKKKGIISEKIVEFDQLLTLETEMELIESKMKKMKKNCTSENEIKIYMKKLGMKRANKFGWPNVYSFTKAMGELQITKFKGSLPVTIIRPTMILSTYKEPFPGWIEGVRTVDRGIQSFCNGEMAYYPASPGAIFDVIPGDMVVNAMLATMISRNYNTHNNDTKDSDIVIYHVGSSAKNILRFNVISEACHKYFSMNPQSKKNGELIAVQKPLLFPTLSCFCLFMMMRHKLPLKGLSLVAMISFSKKLRRKSNRLNQAYKSAMLMAKAYSPYTFMFGRFDDANTEILRMKMNKKDNEFFHFDPICINWDQFMMEIHIPGIMKYGLNA